MNRKNLQLMADHIRKIPREVFDMELFRIGQDLTIKCDSVGCAIGHCPVLDPNPDTIPRCGDGSIDYTTWSFNFTGLNVEQWSWCFSGGWTDVDNTPKGAALRIEWLLNHGLPEDSYEQMEGDSPLCYTTSTN